MAQIMSAPRWLRTQRLGVTNTDETVELDFDLQFNLGLELLIVAFAAVDCGGFNANAFSTFGANFALHQGTGSLEDIGHDRTEGEVTFDSSIICESYLNEVGQEEAGTRGGSAAHLLWSPTPIWNFREILGGTGWLVATNMTFEVGTTNVNFVIGDAHCDILYRYVRLSDSELASLLVRGVR